MSVIEPKNVKQTINDEYWIMDIVEELEEFTKNDVCDLVPKSSRVNITGTK